MSPRLAYTALRHDGVDVPLTPSAPSAEEQVPALSGEKKEMEKRLISDRKSLCSGIQIVRYRCMEYR